MPFISITSPGKTRIYKLANYQIITLTIFAQWKQYYSK